MENKINLRDTKQQEIKATSEWRSVSFLKNAHYRSNPCP